jgi:CRISPR-associated protein Cmr4
VDTRLLFMYAETSIHAGTGSTVSVVDLPIQRERTTQYPVIQGSGVKGALRHQSLTRNGDVSLVFGDDSKDGSTHAGAVSFGDARIVLFPVRSLAGVFAYVTSPDILARTMRDMYHAGLQVETPPAFAQDRCLVASGSIVRAAGTVVLEEFSFVPEKSEYVDRLADWLSNNALPQSDGYLYWRDTLKSRLVILPDDDFRDFVLHSTEVATRVRINAGTKTVADGALWTQEFLPSDSLLVSTVVVRKARGDSGQDVEAMQEQLLAMTPERIQIGGDETTGTGFVALKWA